MSKKFQLTFIFIMVFFLLKAQITISSSDAPSIGMVCYQANDTMPSTSIVPGNGGANQTWNFSGLNVLTFDTIRFVDPAATPYSSNFPGADMTVKTRMNNEPAYYYLTKDNSGVYAIGVAGVLSTAISSVLKVSLVPKMSFLRTPSSYQGAYNETYHYNIKTTAPPAYQSLGDSVKVNSWVNAVSTIDGWGTLTTPGGTYNTIRQYERDINHDTIWFKSWFGWTQFSTGIDTNDVYKWWANSIGNAVAELKMNLHQNKTKSFGWYVAQPSVTEKPLITSVQHVFPNPASDRIFIGNLDPGMEYSIKICDQTGREIYKEKTDHSEKMEIQTNTLVNGMYIMTIFENNIPAKSTKFIINR